MPRRASGQVIEPSDGRAWAIRFRAYGKRRYVTLGTAEDGWNRRRAEGELRHVLADVERGIWRPYEPPPAPEVPRSCARERSGRTRSTSPSACWR